MFDIQWRVGVNPVLKCDTETISCYNIITQLYNNLFTVELANTLNDPEGFLIQARSGTDTSSEIIGTFLDPDDVRARSSAAEVNYKILSCNRSISDTDSQPVSRSN